MDEKPLSDATSFLLNEDVIGERQHREIEIRFVKLNTQDIFNQLVGLYSDLFRTNILFFQNLAFAAADLACIYVSHWFMDLYASNRRALIAMELIDCAGFYVYPEANHSLVYDCYLAELNAQIRPTYLRIKSRDLLYIPVLSSTKPCFETVTDPFAIDGFRLDKFIFRKIILRLLIFKISKMKYLSDDLRGKPSWLLDWYASGAYAWFPKEGHYCMDDITIAYILGVACTTNLGTTDFDEDIPELPKLTVEPNNFLKVTIQEKDQPCEFRPLEFGKWSKCMKYLVGRYQLVHWMYHSQVIHKVDNKARSVAHRMMLSCKCRMMMIASY